MRWFWVIFGGVTVGFKLAGIGLIAANQGWLAALIAAAATTVSGFAVLKVWRGFIGWFGKTMGNKIGGSINW